MRLRKLLIGSAAAVMGAGLVSAPAKAADVNGLVTTTVDYVASCSNGAGVTFNNTCVKLSGSIKWSVGHGQTINFNGGTDNTTNTTTPVDDVMSASFSPKLSFAWSSGGYDVTLSVPLWGTASGVSVTIKRPGGISVTIKDDKVSFSMPFGGWTATAAVEFEGNNPDLDFGINGNLGDVSVGFGVHSDDWNPPTFDAKLGFSFGDWDLTLNGATRGWGTWEPTASALVAGAFGDFKVDLFVGWQDNAGDPDDVAIAGRVRADVAGMGVLLGVIHGSGDATWGGWTDDYGTHPYALAFGDSFYGIWGGISGDWNDTHSTALKIFYSNGIDVPDSEYLRVGVTHTWTPVGGAVTIVGDAWMQNDFGGVGTVFGAKLSASLALIR